MATYKEGWMAQAAPDTETSPITALNLIGYALDKKIINIPHAESIVERHLEGQYYPTLGDGNAPLSRVGMNFVPTNGKFIEWILGNVGAPVSGVRAVTPIDGTARKPRITLWQEINNQIDHYYGVTIGSANIGFRDGRLGCSLTGMGMGYAEDAFTPTLTWLDDKDTGFYHVTDVEWNASGINIIGNGLTLQLDQKLTPFIGTDGKYAEISEFAPIFGTYTLLLTAGDGETFRNDFDTGEKRTFTWKVYRADASGEYLHFTGQCRIQDMVQNGTYNNEPLYTANLITEDITCNVKDGLS